MILQNCPARHVAGIPKLHHDYVQSLQQSQIVSNMCERHKTITDQNTKHINLTTKQTNKHRKNTD